MMSGLRFDCARWSPVMTGVGHVGLVMVHFTRIFMACSQLARVAVCVALGLASAGSASAQGQAGFLAQAGEFGVSGGLAGDQVQPHAALRPSGGFVVWEDNATDGNGLGVSARRLDESLSGSLSAFRVNVAGAGDQNRPQVALLNNGGAVFVWQGGKQGFQRIYGRFMAGDGTWATGDVLLNGFTNFSQMNPAVASLTGGEVVAVWSSLNQEAVDGHWGVFGQRLSATGGKLGGEFRVNVTTSFNQRSPAIAALSDGRFVVVWVGEQQRFENSVDVYARLFTANGAAASSEILVNSDTNVCANPSVAPSVDGGFVIAWMQKDVLVRSNSWDVFARPFSGNGFGGVARRVNTHLYGDQLAPKVSASGSRYLVAWTSMAQDGSREGIYGQFLRGDGSLAGGEFRVNTTTISQQIQPAVASDGNGRFLAVWTGFVGGTASFELQAQRYAEDIQPLPPPAAPFVTVLSSNSVSVTWPWLAGFDVARYEVYVDGVATATAVTTNDWWTMGGLSPGSTHSYRLAYVLTDGRRSPLSDATSAQTYSASATWGGIPQEWMSGYFGADLLAWPSPTVDSDGDGASNRDEFLAGTNPLDPSSALRVRLEKTAQGVFLNWNTRPGLIYQVENSADLQSWSNLGGRRFAAETVDSMYLGLGESGYYRVIRVR